MRTTKNTITGLAVTALGAALALTGCSSSPAPNAASTPAGVQSTAVSSTPTPTATPAPWKSGDDVTNAAMIAACKPSGPVGLIKYGAGDGQCPLKTTQRVYTLASGASVVVDKTQPLPAAVLAEKVALAKTIVVTRYDGAGADAVAAEVAAVAKDVQTTTGKTVVVVVKGAGNVGCKSRVQQTIYMALGPRRFVLTGTCVSFATAQQSYDDAAAAISGFGNAGEYVLIPYQG